MHMLLEHSLPVPMSALFAYAILQWNGDMAVLKDISFLCAAAPGEVQLMSQWPTDAEDFMRRKDEPLLKGLTLEYFDKLVWPSRC